MLNSNLETLKEKKLKNNKLFNEIKEREDV